MPVITCPSVLGTGSPSTHLATAPHLRAALQAPVFRGCTLAWGTEILHPWAMGLGRGEACTPRGVFSSINSQILLHTCSVQRWLAGGQGGEVGRMSKPGSPCPLEASCPSGMQGLRSEQREACMRWSSSLSFSGTPGGAPPSGWDPLPHQSAPCSLTGRGSEDSALGSGQG